MYYKSNTIVLCAWEDAWSSNGWRDGIEVENTPISVSTIGYVVKHDVNGLSLAGTKDDKGTYGSVCFRPKAMIRKITVLKNAPK